MAWGHYLMTDWGFAKDQNAILQWISKFQNWTVFQTRLFQYYSRREYIEMLHLGKTMGREYIDESKTKKWVTILTLIVHLSNFKMKQNLNN